MFLKSRSGIKPARNQILNLHMMPNLFNILMLIRKSAPLRKLNMQLHLSFVSKLLINEIDTVFKAL